MPKIQGVDFSGKYEPLAPRAKWALGCANAIAIVITVSLICGLVVQGTVTDMDETRCCAERGGMDASNTAAGSRWRRTTFAYRRCSAATPTTFVADDTCQLIPAEMDALELAVPTGIAYGRYFKAKCGCRSSAKNKIQVCSQGTAVMGGTPAAVVGYTCGNCSAQIEVDDAPSECSGLFQMTCSATSRSDNYVQELRNRQSPPWGWASPFVFALLAAVPLIVNYIGMKQKNKCMMQVGCIWGFICAVLGVVGAILGLVAILVATGTITLPARANRDIYTATVEYGRCIGEITGDGGPSLASYVFNIFGMVYFWIMSICVCQICQNPAMNDNAPSVVVMTTTTAATPVAPVAPVAGAVVAPVVAEGAIVASEPAVIKATVVG